MLVTAAIFVLARIGSRALGEVLPDLLRQFEVDKQTRWAWTNFWLFSCFASLLTVLSILAAAAYARSLRVSTYLGLKRATSHHGSLAWAVLACPFVTYAGVQVRTLLFDDAGGRTLLLERLLSEGSGVSILGLIAALTLAIPFAEELLYRGFLLRGLNRKRQTLLGILVVSVAFSVSHIEPAEIVALLPVSIWLTLLASWSGCLWPSIAGHMTINGVAVGLILSGGVHQGQLTTWVHALAWLVPFPCFVIALWRLRRADKSPSPTSPSAT